MDIQKLRCIVELIQSADRVEFTNTMLRVFLLLSEEPALSQKDIQDRLNIPPGSIARICASLSEGSPKKGGLKLITGRLNPYDWRSSQYFLTNKGLSLITKINDILRG